MFFSPAATKLGRSCVFFFYSIHLTVCLICSDDSHFKACFHGLIEPRPQHSLISTSHWEKQSIFLVWGFSWLTELLTPNMFPCCSLTISVYIFDLFWSWIIKHYSHWLWISSWFIFYLSLRSKSDTWPVINAKMLHASDWNWFPYIHYRTK